MRLTRASRLDMERRVTKSPGLRAGGDLGLRGVLPAESLVGAGVVGEDGGGELLGELAAEAGDAEGGVAGDFLGDGFVVDGP